MSRILIVDDFGPWRSMVSSMLQNEGGLQVVGQALDGNQAVQKAKELKPDLILLDTGLPDLDGIAAARKVLEGSPKSKIIFLSQESSEDVVAEALSLGAMGYICKTEAQTELLPAIAEVLSGKRFVSRGLQALEGEPRFDIFAGTPDRDAVWVEAVVGLANARDRMEELAGKKSGKYFVFSIYTHLILAQTDTSKRAPVEKPDKVQGAA